MKKIIALVVLCLSFLPILTSAQFTVPQGGTGKASFPLGGWLFASTTLRFDASSSPTVNWITATSTTATSTFGYGINLLNGCLAISGVCVGSGGGTITGTGFAGLLPVWTSATNLTATSSPTVGYLTSTSTATSTFGGPIKMTSGSLRLPATTGAFNGLITIDSKPFLHSYGSDDSNVFLGSNAGNFSMTGLHNVGVGAGVLIANTSGENNVAIGSSTMEANITGGNNIAVGQYALGTNDVGSNNVAVGPYALASNANGAGCMAMGQSALLLNPACLFSAAIGVQSLFNSTGVFNTAIGGNSLFSLTGGNYDTGIGYGVGAATGAENSNNSIAIGAETVFTGSSQFVVGALNHPVYDFYLGEGVLDASTTVPQNISINASGATGTNIPADNLVLAGGKSTGNAEGGSLIFKTSDALSSGTGLQSLTEKMRLSGNGNFGIGTDSPASLLSIASSSVDYWSNQNFYSTRSITDPNSSLALTTNVQMNNFITDSFFGPLNIGVYSTSSSGFNMGTTTVGMFGQGDFGLVGEGNNFGVAGFSTNVGGVFSGNNIAIEGFGATSDDTSYNLYLVNGGTNPLLRVRNDGATAIGTNLDPGSILSVTATTSDDTGYAIRAFSSGSADLFSVRGDGVTRVNPFMIIGDEPFVADPVSTLVVKGQGSSAANNALRVMNSASFDLFTVRDDGHIMTDYATGTKPTVSSCGTGPTIYGNDTNFRVYVGTIAASSCLVTFANAFPNPPVCSVTNEGGTAGIIAYSASSTEETLTIAGTSIVGDRFTAHCEAYISP